MLKRKEFWIAAVTLAVEVVAYFGAKYLAPDAFEDVQFLIGILQPFVLMIIGLLIADGIVRRLKADK